MIIPQKQRALIIATGIAAGMLVACSRSLATRANANLASGALKGSNLLLITVDTLRADRVGAYGGGRLTPVLDRLAANGVRFTHAYSHAPLTLPAHTSIMTGLIPSTHGVHNNGSTALAASTPTLATVLRAAGYRTGAFVGAFVLDARFGLSRGFDAYDDRVGSDTGPITFAFAERTADRVVQIGGDWILSGRSTASPQPPAPSPWFCWMHLFDPHAPYRAPEQRAANPYDNEVAFADAQLGRLFDRLRAAGELDSTIIVVLADHGESLGEHGEATHGLFAYDATLRIPLIIAGPAVHAAASEATVGQADLLPTLLDLLGVPPPATVDGHSLLPAIRGEPAPGNAIYFEALDAYLTRNWAPLTGVIADGWKYIDLPDPELYDLARDPGEAHNAIRDAAARAATLRQRLAGWPGPTAAAAARVPLDPDAAARLRALGYTTGQTPNAARTRFGPADDPKRLLDVDRRYEQALALTGDRHYSEAAVLLQQVVTDRPDFTAAYLNLGSVFIADGRPLQAIEVLQNASARKIGGTEMQARLGAAYLASGDLSRAQSALEPVADASLPGGLEALNSLGVVLTQTGRYDRARLMFSNVLAQSPHAATTWSNLGLLELAANRAAAAARAFEQAVAADPQLAQAWEGLGAARAGGNPANAAGAIDAWRRAFELEPRNYDVLFNIASLLHGQGRHADARPYLERFVREAPPDRYARDIATFRAWLANK